MKDTREFIDVSKFLCFHAVRNQMDWTMWLGRNRNIDWCNGVDPLHWIQLNERNGKVKNWFLMDLWIQNILFYLLPSCYCSSKDHQVHNEVFSPCYHLTASSSGSNDTVECQSSEMQCGSGDCVPLSWQCDGEDDCPDGEDESTCAVLNTCSHGEFR